MSSDPSAVRFEAVYGELRRLAAARLSDEPSGHTLDATALVHEAYLRLRGAADLNSPGQYFRAAAEAMRRILVDHARRKRAVKRGGRRGRFDISESDRIVLPDPDTVLSIDEALEELASHDPTAAEVARLRLFAGLTVDAAAEALGVSRATAYRDWAYARAYLTAALSGE